MQRALISLLLAGLAAAQQDARLRISVDEAGLPRAGRLVRLELEIGRDVPSSLAAYFEGPLVLRTPAGEVIPVDMERSTDDGRLRRVTLWWIHRGGSEAALDLGPPPNPPSDLPPRYLLEETAARRDLRRGERRLWRHVIAFDPADHERTKKPFHHLFAFHDEGFLTKGPGGLYSHHRGLFFGYSRTRVEGRAFDFWHCRRGIRQRHRGRTNDTPDLFGHVVARVATTTDWLGPDGRALVRDERVLTTWSPDPRSLVLDVRLVVRALAGPVRLDGDPQHAGFQIRLAQELAEHPERTRYVRPVTARPLGNDVWASCDWAACDFSVRGYRYVVLHADHPSNPRPTVYSTRSYGRFGAFCRARVTPEKPLELRYRVVVFDVGDGAPPDTAALAAWQADFARPAIARPVIEPRPQSRKRRTQR